MPEHSAYALDALPESLRDIAETIGIAATLRLVEWRGGVRLWIPQELRAGEPLAQVLGLEAAQRLIERYGCERIYLPRCARALREARNAEIRARYRECTASELAREYALTDRQIWRIVATSHRDRSGQQDLL